MWFPFTGPSKAVVLFVILDGQQQSPANWSLVLVSGAHELQLHDVRLCEYPWLTVRRNRRPETPRAWRQTPSTTHTRYMENMKVSCILLFSLFVCFSPIPDARPTQLSPYAPTDFPPTTAIWSRCQLPRSPHAAYSSLAKAASLTDWYSIFFGHCCSICIAIVKMNAFCDYQNWEISTIIKHLRRLSCINTLQINPSDTIF